MTAPKPKAAMRGFLAVALVGAYMTGLFWVINFEIPEQNEALVNYMLGGLNGMSALAVGFYFATNQSAVDQQDAIRSDPRLPPTPEPDRPFGEGRDLPRPTFAVENPDPENN